MIVVPRKHVATVYEFEVEEQQSVWALVAEARGRLLTGLTPDTFDIGFDGGVHAAVHIVPRRAGDGLGEAEGSYVTDGLHL